MSETLEYVINSGAWSLGGLVVGYLLGRLERNVRSIRDRLDEEDRDDHA